MTNWTAGYVADIDYSHGYYQELSPEVLSLAMLNKGIATRNGRPFRYLELGFGQGLSLAIHAAACEGEFWGIDFNPGQAANAKELAESFGAGEHIYDQSFEEFAARDDLPEFDVITLHGIWSWVSDESRAVIIDLARRKLAFGGVLYISYNCFPGSAPMAPLRHLLSLHAELSGPGDYGLTGRIDKSLEFAEQIVDCGAHYFLLNPAVTSKLQALKGLTRKYLAHEYFNRHWELMAFSDVCEMLADAKLTFAASATLLDHVDTVNLTPARQALLAEITHPILRESVRDYIVNAQFRRDIFVKGGREMNAVQRNEAYLAQRFVLVSLPEQIPSKMEGLGDELIFDQNIYQPLIAAMAEQEHAPKTLRELAGISALKHRPLAHLIEALLVLYGGGHVLPAQNAESVESAKPRCRLLNAHIINRARFSEDIVCLASPVTGGGFRVVRMEQLFLFARQADVTDPSVWAHFVWQSLSAAGRKITKDGVVLEAAEENIAELLAQANEFAAKRLPILQALQVVE
ncbi:MAG: class I SAM-dependent methyltransferase [Pseudomonadota bacterium]